MSIRNPDFIIYRCDDCGGEVVNVAETNCHCSGVKGTWTAIPVIRTDSATAPVAFSESYDADKSRHWAWERVKEMVTTVGWTVGDKENFFGFFCWGWDMRRQFNEQRNAEVWKTNERSPGEQSKLESLISDGYEMTRQLRHLGDNDIDSDSFAVVIENYNGTEIDFERPITELALQASEIFDELLSVMVKVQNSKIDSLPGESHDGKA